MDMRSVMTISLLTGLLTFAPLSFSQDVSYDNSTVTAQTPKEDAVVTNAVKKLIHKSKTLSKLKVDVSTNKGVVMLNGMVDSETQASSLVELTESVVGVSDVDTSKLTVKDSTQPLTDTFITAKIKGLLIREKLFGEKDIAAINTSVETKDGVVYLSGIIDNKEQIDNAIEIIKKNVPEVKKVEYSAKEVIPVNNN